MTQGDALDEWVKRWDPPIDQYNHLVELLEKVAASTVEDVTKNEETKKEAETHKEQTDHKVMVVPARAALFFCDKIGCKHGGLPMKNLKDRKVKGT